MAEHLSRVPAAVGCECAAAALAVQSVMPTETGFKQDLCADVDELSLHAAVRCGADDRQAQ
jgi:hypothetical protein